MGVNSLLPLRGTWGANSDQQTWWQAMQHAEPSQWSKDLVSGFLPVTLKTVLS